jgi:hypothetical protein
LLSLAPVQVPNVRAARAGQVCTRVQVPSATDSQGRAVGECWQLVGAFSPLRPPPPMREDRSP